MKALSLAFLMVFSFSSAQAQGLNSVEMDQISIDGQYNSYANTQRRESASDRLKKYRQKLERRNEIMMRKKMEEIRFQHEKRLMKKMQKAMNQTMKAIDNIQQ